MSKPYNPLQREGDLFGALVGSPWEEDDVVLPVWVVSVLVSGELSRNAQLLYLFLFFYMQNLVPHGDFMRDVEEHLEANRYELHRWLQELHDMALVRYWGDVRTDNPSGYIEFFIPQAGRRAHSPNEIRRMTQQVAGAHTRASRFTEPGTYTVWDWDNTCAISQYRCACCNKRHDVLHIDHVVPLSLGGSDHIANIQPLCRRCNSRKGTDSTDHRMLIITSEQE